MAKARQSDKAERNPSAISTKESRKFQKKKFSKKKAHRTKGKRK